MTREGIWLLGGGGHAKVAIATATAAGVVVEGVFDDDAAKKGTPLLGVPILGPTPEAQWWAEKDRAAFIAIGGNLVRQRIAQALKADWTSIVHPAALLHEMVRVGGGTLLCAGAVVQPDADIAAHAIVNTGAVIEHDCRVGAFAHIGPAACLAGDVTVGEGAFIGAGATVIPGISIGPWAIVGAGAAVVADVAANATVTGVPAKAKR